MQGQAEFKPARYRLTWESWEHLIKSKIDDLEYLLDQTRTELSLNGMSFEKSEAWIDQRIKEMQQEIRKSKGNRRIGYRTNLRRDNFNG